MFWWLGRGVVRSTHQARHKCIFKYRFVTWFMMFSLASLYLAAVLARCIAESASVQMAVWA